MRETDDTTRARKRQTRGVAILALASIALRGDVVIPSAVNRSGLNQALFVSDVRIFNPSTSPVEVTPIFYDQTTGTAFTKPAFTVPPRAELAYDNVLESLFGLGLGPFGPIRFQTAGPLVVSTSVNNRNGCGNGSTSGQWLPGIDTANALLAGTLVHLAASADSKTGYRTNLDFVNVGTEAANVSVKIHKGDGSLLSAATLPPIGPNALFQRPIDDAVYPGVAGTTDTNLWAEFTSDQKVLAFASVINNASGDPFAIVQIADPAVPPVASYTFSPTSPLPGEPVTFTDASTNSPATQLWSFGDGGTATDGTSVTHTYPAPGVYRSAHFVTNAAGVSASALDVVVTAPVEPTPSPTVTPTPTATPTAGGTVSIAITASQWDFNPETVTLKVGTRYQITYTSTDVIHGVGGLALLGITNCNVIAPTAPCTATITPRSNQVGTFNYSCSQTSCGAGHQTMTGRIVVQP